MRLTDYVRTVRARGRASNRAKARRKPSVAFVLSGGGVLGAAQVGQLQALIEAGIIPDAVVATSVGALNGAAVAADPTPEGCARLAEVWRGLKTEDIFPGSRFARAWNIVSRGDHIHPNTGLRRLVEQLPAGSFEDTAIPVWISATNLRTGDEHWFSHGSLMRAILASTALPGIFPPVAIDGELYIDGGVVNNVPISRAISLGAKRVYVLTCGTATGGQRPIRRPLDVLVQAFAHARRARVPQDIEHFGTTAEIIMMPTFDPGYIAYNDPSQSTRLIERAHAISASFLAAPTAIEATAQA
ncbi:MAG: patatin-like phospholipase family protein [Actinomycetota bacterium]